MPARTRWRSAPASASPTFRSGLSNNGNNFNVGVKHAGSPNEQAWQITDLMTVLNWNNPFDRIEKFSFADGTVLDLATTALDVPFGAAMSGGAVAERSPAFTVVGTVHGFDFAPNAVLTYATVDGAGGRFAVDATTGNIMVVDGTLLNYDVAQSYQSRCGPTTRPGIRSTRLLHHQHHRRPQPRPGADVPASKIPASAGQTLQVSGMISASDADNDALTYYFYDNSAAANSGHFVLNGTPVAANTSFGVSAAQLAQLTFVAGAANSVDDLSVQLWDGHALSALGQLTFTSIMPRC